jgi:glucosamine-6-phosphate deaminase
MGIGTIMHAKRILLIANGIDKADAIAKIVTGPVTPEVPGSILQLHPDVTIVCDEAALSLIR